MNPDIEMLKGKIAQLEARLNAYEKSDRLEFQKSIRFIGNKLGFFSADMIARPSTAGTTGYMTTVGGTTVTESNGFKGYANTGTAYTIGDIVGALKALVLIAP